jgi:hypothetical protein
MQIDDPKDMSSSAELRSMILDMMEDQVLSSFDTILLLLLPLSIFALGVTPWLWTSLRFLAPWTLSFAFASFLPLGILVSAKLRGNVQSRILAWIMFIVMISCVAGSLVFVVALSLFVRLPIATRPGFEPLFIIGILTLSYGLSYRQVRGLKHLLLRRIHWKSSEIRSMFSSYETIHRCLSSITKRDWLFGTLFGLTLLLLFVRYGVLDAPWQWASAINFILLLPIVAIIAEIAWSRLSKRFLKPIQHELAESTKSLACVEGMEGPSWLTIIGVAIWLVFFVALALALAGIAFVGIYVYPSP